MTFQELCQLVDDIKYDERNTSVRFGCDCGCGGDSYTWEQWDEMCLASDVAVNKLKKLGIEFDE